VTLTDEQLAVRDLFRDFAAKEIRPVAAELDEHPRFPEALFKRAGELGFFGMRYPEPEGTGMDLTCYLLAVEELAYGSLGVAATCAMQSLMGTYFLHAHAGGAVRERLLGPALRGEKLGTICMTEPDAGSDLLAMKTQAEERDGQWFVTGPKTWITSAPIADFFTVFARTGERELSIFLVERDAAGLSVGRAIDKMGVRASLTSEVTFADTPATCLLGTCGQGLDSLFEILVEIRLMTAALALGVGRAALEEAVTYSKQRVQFGKPICRHQAVQLHLGEMRTSLAAARSLTEQTAERVMAGLPSTDEAAMAKLFASEAAHDVCDRAARIMASYGYAREYPVERLLRDVRFTLIGGGTSEILKLNIAKGLTR